MLSFASLFDRLRAAYRNRWLSRTLAGVREPYQDSVRELARFDDLDQQTRALLRPMLRQFAAQRAAAVGSRWWHIYSAARVLTALVLLGAPAWILVSLIADHQPTERAASAVLYAVLLGCIAAAYGRQQDTVTVLQLGLVAVAAVVVLALWWLVTPWRDLLSWRVVQPALATTAVTVALTIVRLSALITLRDRLIWPLALWWGGYPLPSQLATVHLLLLVDALREAAPTNRHPRYRRNFIRWMNVLITFIERQLPTTARQLNLGRAVVVETQQLTRDLAAQLRALQNRLLHEPGPDAYTQVRAEAATLVADLARGTWAAAPADGSTGRTQTALARFGRKAGAAAALLALAGALPHLPGIAADSATVGGIQLGLVVAAALTLLPVEATHRDQALSAFREPGP
ncbi:hypothetical protein [Phytohabitans aurantiacus]|uniref:Integral membrane protein n=1 Tax=Phytohabitans aurantiacus TaxID=3016789 RepID=A0ABQ5R8T1_9ACTN|nr:hypothetical protein [Phytohabitans aurantiacus]GLI02996.1 hypothetical protein Pa4123_82740 [Phytohabitans aurantiacus]